jgi:hypothetical protein
MSRGAIPNLRLEKTRFLFLEGSTGAAGAASVAAAAPPDASAVRAGTSAACAGTSAASAASVMDCLATGTPTPAPGACSLTASAALGKGDAGSQLSRRARPLSSSSSSSPDDESSEVAGGESPCCSRSRNSSSHCSRRSRCRILFSFLRAALSCSRRCAARAHAQARGVGGSDRVASTTITCEGRAKLRVTPTPRGSIARRGRESTHQRAVGEHDE